MKIKLADIPINIIDGIDKYPRAAIAIFCALAGVITVSLTFGHWGVFAASCAGMVGGLVLAWHMGKPK